jgi:L-iditol 2-dehydrogenase
MKMKAAVFKEIDRIAVQEVDIPELPEDGILVKVKACAICGSDIRIYHSGHPMIIPPQVMGHEIAGEIVKTGAAVTKFRVGDRVAVGADSPCGACEMCEKGLGTYCLNLNGVGYTIAGGFAEYCVFPGFAVRNGPIHNIPDHVPYDQAALAEPLGCILNGMERIGVKMGDTVVIMGAGPIGCMMVSVLNSIGAAKVIMMDTSADRIELARRVKADVYVCSSQEDGVARVLRETAGKGADVVITANSAWRSHTDAMKMAAIRGRVCLFGGLPEGTLVPQFDTNVIHYRELNLLGAHGAQPRHHKLALDMISSGRIDVSAIITHHFPLSDFGKAMATAEGREGLKVIIEMNND